MKNIGASVLAAGLALAPSVVEGLPLDGGYSERIAVERCRNIVETTISDIDFILERQGVFSTNVAMGLPFSKRIRTDLETACVGREQKSIGCKQIASDTRRNFLSGMTTLTGSILSQSNRIEEQSFQECMGG